MKDAPAVVDEDTLSPEEEAQAKLAEELAKQKEELDEAKQEVAAAAEEPPPAPWVSIKKHVGVGPLAYETRRGLVKAHSGDVIMTFEYDDLGVDGLPIIVDGQPVKVRDTIIVAAEGAKALFPGLALPERAEDIAQRKGEVRRKAEWDAAHPPATSPAPPTTGTKPALGEVTGSYNPPKAEKVPEKAK